MDSSSMGFPPLPEFYRLRWNLRFDQDFDAPRYLGSALRGLMGHGLKRTVCVTRSKQCASCALADTCPYTRLFEPSATGESHSRVPYVLALPFTGRRTLKAGSVLPLEMTLFAPHERQLPYLVHAFQTGGRLGLGPENRAFSVESVFCLEGCEEEQWRPVFEGTRMLHAPTPFVPKTPPMPGKVRLTWLTPLRIKRRGHLVGPDRFDGGLLLESLAYRWFDLLGSRPDPSLLAMIRNSSVAMRGELYWQDWGRYSSRQKTRMRIGGLLGSVELDLCGLESWWPLLWAVQWLHLGKFTSIGLGRYRLGGASLSMPLGAG